jgi:hypothetical protein
MGAVTFIEKVRAKSLSAAYTKAVEEANEEHGHEQGYSGNINSADPPRDVTKDYKGSKKSLSDYIESKLDNAGKRDCFGICLEEPVANTNKTKAVVENVVIKGTVKWILEYVVYEGSIIGLMDDGRLKAFPTKGLAISHGRAHTEKTGRRTSVVMEKTMEKGSAVVARISYKKSTNEKDGLYCLFGLAPE